MVDYGSQHHWMNLGVCWKLKSTLHYPLSNIKGKYPTTRTQWGMWGSGKIMYNMQGVHKIDHLHNQQGMLIQPY